MAVVAFGIGRWLGVSLDGTVRPFAYTLGFWALMTSLVAWTLVRRHGQPR
jgi:DHA1 family bicyclomycin/chloramphenicol resistance-like MFS transporter